MKLGTIAAAASLLTCSLSWAAPPPPAPKAAPAVAQAAAPAVEPAPAKINTAELARKIVRSANLREKDLVTVRGGMRDEALLDDIALEVAKAGAHPLRVLLSERYAQRWWDEVPERNDAPLTAAQLKLVSAVDADINIEWVENPGYLNNVLPERQAAGNKAQRIVTAARLKRNTRIINLGNGLYPTDTLAKRFGVSKNELTRLFWDAVNVDYAKLKTTGEVVRNLMKNGKEIRVTNVNGTDLKMRIGGRQVFVSDGVLTDEKVKKGGASCLVWLPAGEVYLAPVPGSAEGTVVFDRAWHEDKEIRGLKLTFKAGKLTDMSAKSGAESLKVAYDAAGPGKGDFGFIDVGINPSFPSAGKVLSYMPAGMITIGIGGDAWAGGTNTAEFSFEGFQPNSTLQVDGKLLVDAGALKLENL
ncbi:MAG: aminopeptidase [Myxococcaceae bacterium]